MKVGGWGGTHRDERELEAARLCRNNAPSRVGALHFAAPSSGCHQHEAPGDAAALFFLLFSKSERTLEDSYVSL